MRGAPWVAIAVLLAGCLGGSGDDGDPQAVAAGGTGASTGPAASSGAGDAIDAKVTPLALRDHDAWTLKGGRTLQMIFAAGQNFTIDRVELHAPPGEDDTRWLVVAPYDATDTSERCAQVPAGLRFWSNHVNGTNPNWDEFPAGVYRLFAAAPLNSELEVQFDAVDGEPNYTPRPVGGLSSNATFTVVEIEQETAEDTGRYEGEARAQWESSNFTLASVRATGRGSGDAAGSTLEMSVEVDDQECVSETSTYDAAQVFPPFVFRDHEIRTQFVTGTPGSLVQWTASMKAEVALGGSVGGDLAVVDFGDEFANPPTLNVGT